jgi:Tfp pilus assembly protein FimT
VRTSLGLTVCEALVIVTLLAVGLAVALPAMGSIGSRARTAAGARQLATQLQAMRWKSVARGVVCGMAFARDATGWYWLEVEDGNGNGLRRAELRNGTDRTLSGPHRLERMVEEVRLGFPGGGPFPAIPPRSGRIDSLHDPVQFGQSDLVAFTPLGSSSSGTLYLSDGREGLFAVVLFGRTARIRIWRYEGRSRRWRL